jgi:hypothetical protein
VFRETNRVAVRMREFVNTQGSDVDNCAGPPRNLIGERGCHGQRTEEVRLHLLAQCGGAPVKDRGAVAMST